MDCEFSSQSTNSSVTVRSVSAPECNANLPKVDFRFLDRVHFAQRSSPPSAQPVAVKFESFELSVARQNVVASMSPPERDESYVELAVDVLKTQDLASIKALRDFLTVLSNPLAVENVLKTAIRQLAEGDPEACRWVLRHPASLMPDLDLKDLALKRAFNKLRECGFLFGEEFGFDSDGKLYASDLAKSQLLAESSNGDRLLLEEILQIRHSP